MKKKVAFTLCAALMLCSMSVAALAAEPMTDADTVSTMLSAADTLPGISAYPAEVRASEENGVYRLEKVYYLTAKDDPAAIPTADFEREGRTYTLLDLLKNDQTETDTREHIEVVTLESKTKDMMEILKMLEPKLEVKTEDGYLLDEYKAPNGTMKQRAKGKDGEAYELRDLFEAYAQFGGMPALAEAELDQERANMLLDGIYSAVVVRDILERGKRKEQRAVTDALLLRKIILFLADNIGNNTSAASIGRTLVSEGLLDDGRKAKPAVQTISAYIDALLESYIFYEVKRFDIKGKDYLRTLGKYYIVDPGLRTYLLGNRGGDVGHILENIVYFELLRRGYEVAIGKVGEKEIDFIATKMNEKKYIQVTDNMNAPETRARELAPLQAVQDNYEKIVIAMDCDLISDVDGIKIVKALDFLLSEV